MNVDRMIRRPVPSRAYRKISPRLSRGIATPPVGAGSPEAFALRAECNAGGEHGILHKVCAGWRGMFG
jgi:hypothetical protein